MNKKFPFMFAVFLFLLIPNVSAEFLIHNGNTVTTGNIVWHIQSDYLTQFLKIKIIPINETCVNIHTEPTDYLLQLYEDSQSMNTGDFNKKYVHLQKGTRNVLSDVKTLDKVPIEALKGFSLRHIKHTKDFNTFDALESNDLQVCNIAKGNYIKFGFGTTTIEITNATTHLTLNPETTYCLMNCEHEITLFNNDTVAHSISINNITIENPSEMQNVKFYAYVPVNISVPIYANKTEYYINDTTNSTNICNLDLDYCYYYNETYCACDVKDLNNIIGYETKSVLQWTTFDSYTVEPSESLQLKLEYIVPKNSNGKFNITINFDGYYFNIDPYWNSDWSNKKIITINGNTPIGYQIPLNITYEPEMNQDFSDIRFVNGSENEELPYWIDRLYTINGSYALVWVKLDQAVSGNYTIYMYYGNQNAIDQSNGTAVFDYFDDFESYSNGTSLFDVGYLQYASPCIDYHVYDGIGVDGSKGVRVSSSSGDNYACGIAKDFGENRTNVRFLMDYRAEVGTQYYVIGFYDELDYLQREIAVLKHYSSRFFYMRNFYTEQNLNGSNNITETNDWVSFDYMAYLPSGYFYYQYDNNNSVNITAFDTTFDSFRYGSYVQSYGVGEKSIIDNWRIAKYVYPEPTYLISAYVSPPIPEPEISDEVIAGAVIIVISLIFAIVNYILRLV